MSKTVLVTGAAGFIGRHVMEALERRPGVHAIGCDIETTLESLQAGQRQADVVVHLAGVNRPRDPAEFKTGNSDFTSWICAELKTGARCPILVLSSSIQASLDNPYGQSKRAAEVALEEWASAGGGRAILFRLRNVFGKWCRPNYNSVTATFCHNIAHHLPIQISDETRELELVYIDDVIEAFLACIDLPMIPGVEKREVSTYYQTTLGELAATLRSFGASRETLLLPAFSTEFMRRLYATYLSYLSPEEFSYPLQQRTDDRGTLAEFMKSGHFGQIFVSRTKPGVTRGNHYHHTKTEKFLVMEGSAIIRFRAINGQEIIEHRVDGGQFRVIDIPPGYTHSIQNVGVRDLVTLFWASEIYDPQAPDTIALSVVVPQ